MELFEGTPNTYKKNKKNLITRENGLYDDEFQKRLIKIFIEDRDKFKNDVQYINQNAFTNPVYKTISGVIKDFVSEYDYIPCYEILNSVMASKISCDIDLQLTTEHLKEIQFLDTQGLDFVKEESIKFFKRQELTKFFNQQLEDIKRGVDITVKDLQTELGKIMEIGQHEVTFTSVYDNFEETFSPETVVHIPTGCNEIDEYLQGGIIKNNLVLVCSSSGVGKTSIATAFAQSAATHCCEANNNNGFKVIQIFFEDKPNAIRKKHFGAITKIEARFIATEEYCEVAKKLALEYEHKELIKNNIKIASLRNGEITPIMIKQLIVNEINKGFKPDMVILDYFECIANPVVKNISNEWKLETEKMRQIENLTKDFGCAVMVMTQATKQAAEGMLVTLDKIGGSAGKYQVGHMILTLNRTQKDAEENRAELFIPKNREGKSGRVFRIRLNNGMPKIEVDDMFDSIDNLKEKQTTDSRNIPPPSEANKLMAEHLKNRYNR